MVWWGKRRMMLACMSLLPEAQRPFFVLGPGHSAHPDPDSAVASDDVALPLTEDDTVLKASELIL